MKCRWEALYRMMNHLAAVGPKHYNHTVVAVLCMVTRDEVKVHQKRLEIKRLSHQLSAAIAEQQVGAAAI